MVCGSYTGGDTGLTTEFSKGRRRGVVDGIHVVELQLPYSNRLGFIKRSLLFLKFALRSIQIALTEPSDIVFATSTPLTAGIPGIATKVLTRKKFVFEVRDLWPELPRAMGVIRNPILLKAMEALEWLSYQSADHCIGLSPGIAEGIKKKGKSTDQVSMIPNGCDLELFSKSGGEDYRIPGISATDLVAVFAGTHGIANGLDKILDVAAELVRRNDYSIKFVFVGDGKCKPTLQTRAHEQTLINCVFLDPMPKTQLAQLLQRADLGIMALANVPAFYYGTSPNKFFDYLAVGLPVINNYPGWVADIVLRSGCGFVVTPDNPIEYADTLQGISCNRSILHDMPSRCRALANNQFSRAQLASDFVRTLESVYQGSPLQLAADLNQISVS